MNSKYGGTMGYQRLIKTIKSIGGGGGDGELTADSIDSSHIINGSILSTDICNNTITGSNIAVGTITSSNILNGTILETDISNNAITFDKLAYNSVGNTRIINGAVTHEKLSSNCIQSHNIVNGTILGSDISDATITASNIAVGTITSSNIAYETIVGDNIANETIGLNKIEPFVGETLKKLLNPTGLITIYNRGSSTAWFAFKIYSKDDIGNYNQTYDYPIKLFPQGTAYCYYINNKFDYGINPILRIRILYNTVNYFACLQGASIGDSSIDVDDSWFDFEDVFFDTNNIFFEVEQV